MQKSASLWPFPDPRWESWQNVRGSAMGNGTFGFKELIGILVKTEDKTEYIRALLKMRDNCSDLNTHFSSLPQGHDSPSGSYLKQGK